MVVQATLMLPGPLFVMSFADALISAGIGIAPIITAIMSSMDGNIFALAAAQRYFSGCDLLFLLALSFLSLDGSTMNKGGATKRLVRFTKLLVGWVSGHLTTTNALANIFFGAVSDSSATITSATGSIMSPLKLDKGHDSNYSVAVNACPASTGTLVPPSGPLVLYSIAAGSVSVAVLFTGGYLTGALFGITTTGPTIFSAVREDYRASAMKGEDSAWEIVLETVLSLLAVIIVMGGILTGIFTVTEAGVVIYLYYMLLAIIYREMSIKTFYDLLTDTMKSPATIPFLIVASSIIPYVMPYSDTPATTSEGLVSVSNNRYMIILIMNVFLLVMGMSLDLTSAVLIFTPVFPPIITGVGMSPVHFGLMLTMSLGIGSVTPSVGSHLFVGCGASCVEIEGVTKYTVPIFTTMVVSLFLVSPIPTIPLLVPYLCGLAPSMWW